MNYYKIAGLHVAVNYGKLKGQKELEDFRVVETVSQPDISISYDYNDNSIVEKSSLDDKESLKKYLLGEATIHNNLLLINETLGVINEPNAYLIFYKLPKLIYGYRAYKNSTEVVIYANSAEADRIDTVNIILNKDSKNRIEATEEFLYSFRDGFFFQALKFGRIPIHSASISYKGWVWLFSAPSGTGKSTHVRMWEEASIPHENFNGDVALIYRGNDGLVYAGALPWCGTSKIYTNKDMLLGGIFFLKRGKTNVVSEISGSDRVLKILARTLTANYDRKLVSDIIDIAEDLEKDIFLSDLICNISPEAAICAREFIDEKMLKMELDIN